MAWDRLLALDSAVLACTVPVNNSYISALPRLHVYNPTPKDSYCITLSINGSDSLLWVYDENTFSGKKYINITVKKTIIITIMILTLVCLYVFHYRTMDGVFKKSNFCNITGTHSRMFTSAVVTDNFTESDSPTRKLFGTRLHSAFSWEIN